MTFAKTSIFNDAAGPCASVINDNVSNVSELTRIIIAFSIMAILQGTMLQSNLHVSDTTKVKFAGDHSKNFISCLDMPIRFNYENPTICFMQE